MRNCKFFNIVFSVLAYAMFLSCSEERSRVESHTHISAGQLNIWSYEKVFRINGKLIDSYVSVISEEGDIVELANGVEIKVRDNFFVEIGEEVIGDSIRNIVVSEDGSVVNKAFICTFD